MTPDIIVALFIGACLGFIICFAKVKVKEVEPSPRVMFDRLVAMRAERLSEKVARREINKLINDAVEKITGEKCNDF